MQDDPGKKERKKERRIIETNSSTVRNPLSREEKKEGITTNPKTRKEKEILLNGNVFLVRV